MKKVKVLLMKNLRAAKFGVSISKFSQRYAEMTDDASRFYVNVDEDENSTLRICTDGKDLDILERF